MHHTHQHIYPAKVIIQFKVDQGYELSAEEEVLYLVHTGQLDKESARLMLQDFFPDEVFPEIK